MRAAVGRVEETIMGRMDGKVAIVTGGASGIGEASAKVLAREGAAVVLTDVNAEEGERVAQEIRDAGGTADFLQHDVAEEREWQAVVKHALDAHGKLDALVNNAGIAAACALTDMSLEKWRDIMRVNLDGVFLGVKHGILAMRQSGGGSIINISSIDGIMGAPLRAHYCASKGGVRLLTKSAAVECTELGYAIRVNSVHPGPIATNIFAAAFERSDPALIAEFGGGDAVGEYYTTNTPMHRFGAPDEIANGVLFLASDESSYMTGAELVIDGGWCAAKSMGNAPAESASA